MLYRIQFKRLLLLIAVLGLMICSQGTKVEPVVRAQEPTNLDDIFPSLFSQQVRLSAGDGTQNDSFGNAVAMSSTSGRIVVGASRQPSQNNRGAAYVYLRNGANWSQEQKLLPQDVVNGDTFGAAVAIDNLTVIVGAPTKAIGGTPGKGAVYVFVNSGSGWTQQQQLLANDGGLNEFFGTSVAISGNTIVVGAVNHPVGGNTRQGAAYVFVRNGTTWTQQQELNASDGLASDQLGCSVALVGDTAVVGAREDNFGANRNGKAYVFTRTGTTWSQQQKLTAADGSALDAFGNSVSLNHSVDTIAVGAFNDNENTLTDTGSAYIFVKNGNTWSQQQRVLGSLQGATGQSVHFGNSVVVDGDTLIVGSPLIDPLNGSGRGAVYLFDRSGSTWSEQNRFTLPPVALREFGTAVAFSGDTFVGTAVADTVGANVSQGSAYVFSTGQSLSVDSVSTTEPGPNLLLELSINVHLSAPSTHPVAVNYSTADGTAMFGLDYEPRSGTLKFNPGETVKTITTFIIGDSVVENNETFFLTLSDPVNASVSAAGVIQISDSPLPFVQFSESGTSLGEAIATTTLTITRSGDTSNPSSVKFSTFDSTATAHDDYTATSGTLHFAAGETSKTINVAINDDSYVEGNETFDVALFDPVDANLGDRFVIHVTITDTPTEPATNVIDDPRDFAGQHYHDFLNRQPDQSGWDFWTNDIASCGNNAQCVEVKRINVSAAFYLSIEFNQTGYLVERLYRTAYGDASGTSTLNGSHQLAVPILRLSEFLPDTRELGQGVVVGATGWEQLLENNKQAFVLAFVQRSRFTTALPTTMSPTQFVDKLNLNAGNVLSASERATLIALFGSATDTANVGARAQAVRGVAEDADLNAAEFNRAFVLFEYFGYLRRNPNDAPDSDYTGFDFWLTKLNNFHGNFVQAESVKAFIQSSEYRGRFGSQ